MLRDRKRRIRWYHAMDEREFLHRADAQLAVIETALDACAADIDFELKPGGIIEVEFADGSKIIVNRHVAAREIWVAARSGGFHFRWDGMRWIDSRNGADLMAALSRCASDQAGEPVLLG